MENPEDAVLVDKTLEGDADSFSRLVDKYWPMAYQLCYQWTKNHAESEDTAQEAFIKAQRYLRNLNDKEQFSSWFYGLVIQLIKERHRKKDLNPQTIAGEIADRKSGLDTERLMVRDALDALPEEFRLVLILRFYKDMSCDEIAGHLKEPVGTVTSRLTRAYRALKEKLK